MTDPEAPPDGTAQAVLHPTLTESLTLAAAHDTGLPGARIVVPSPTSRPAVRPRRHLLRGTIRFGALLVALMASSVVVDRLNPALREGGDIPVPEYLAWFLVRAGIALSLLLILMGVALVAASLWRRLRG